MFSCNLLHFFIREPVHHTNKQREVLFANKMWIWISVSFKSFKVKVNKFIDPLFSTPECLSTHTRSNAVEFARIRGHYLWYSHDYSIIDAFTSNDARNGTR